jgi:hypothetical protein
VPTPGRPHTDKSIPDPRISRGHYLRVRISGGYGEVVSRGSNGVVVSVPPKSRVRFSRGRDLTFLLVVIQGIRPGDQDFDLPDPTNPTAATTAADDGEPQADPRSSQQH